MELYLLDMGSKIYGDCIVVIEGNRKILIDGAHPGDWKSSGGTPSIPQQLGKLFGQPPFHFDLLVVTHCHSDHIGCLPKLVKDGMITCDTALVADEELGFPTSAQDAALDAETAKVVAALLEEPQPDLRGAALDEFLSDVASGADKYRDMLEKLEQDDTTIVRYTGPSTKVSQIENDFADFHLKVLGPTNAHLKKCRDLLARTAQDAAVAIDSLRGVDAAADAVAIYRRLVGPDIAADASLPDSLRAVVDMAGSGAARNDQSIVLKLGADDEAVLLTADMQLAKSEVPGLDSLMATLLQKIAENGPYQFVKVPHHASYNAFDEDVLAVFENVPAFGISTGRNDPKHPQRDVLELLSGVTDRHVWGRTDKNGRVKVSFEGGQVRLGKQRGRLNDASANIGDALEPAHAATPGEATLAGAHAQGGATVRTTATASDQVEVIARIPHVATRVTITVDVAPAAAPNGGGGGGGGQSSDPRLRRPPSDYQLAGGRPLPKLLFVTKRASLVDNIGESEAGQAIRAIQAAGQPFLDVGDGAEPVDRIREVAPDDIKGVVILGGYDVLPAERYDVLPPSVRANLGDSSDSDPDGFIVWSDQIYGDMNGDGLGDIPVSRIPDGNSAALVRAALSTKAATAQTPAFGLRNWARPFADGVFVPGVIVSGAMLKSRPTDAQGVNPGSVDADRIYIMLHGSDTDTSRFWGEQQGQMLEAMHVGNLPDPCGGVVFAGCCWGALTVRGRALFYRDNQPIPTITPAQSLAMSFLMRGARAFIGCTGAHYSPIDGDFQYFGGPMHHSFWKHLAAGKAPAEALFQAKIDYIGAMPHGRATVEEIAIENKILRQFTCLGLGW